MSAGEISIGQWLRSLLRQARLGRSPLRPPGAISEAEFVKRCIKCNKCAQVCPYGSIEMAHIDWGAKFGTPIIFPQNKPCYLCMKCPPVCPTGALNPELRDKTGVKMGVAQIDENKCFTYNGIICRTCFERCPIYREAITLKDELYPVVHADKCVGCGICEYACPAEEKAIVVKSAHAV